MAKNYHKTLEERIKMVKQEMSRIPFKDSWITDGIDETVPPSAEQFGKYMADKDLSASKIRNIYGEIKRIQMGQFENEKASFYLLRPKMAYALGRDKNNYGLIMFKLLFDQSFNLVNNQKTFQNFCNFIEALLAYHRAYKEDKNY